MPIDRRRFIAYSAVASLAPGAVAAATRQASRREQMLQMNGYAVNAETPLNLLTDYLTPNELFFVRSHWTPRFPVARTWRLVIDGEVERPASFTLADLRAMPASDVTCVLQCAGNGRGHYSPVVPGVQWRYGAAGNARWRGVRVRELLEHAGVRPVAAHLHLFGSDDPPEKVPPFHRSLEISKALDDALLAYEMNGVALPAVHGAPLRLVVPGWAGDHWMKWVTRISPQMAAASGFYMDTAYRYPLNPGAPGVSFKPEEMRPVTALAVKSNITTSPARARVGRPETIRGFAFSGVPDVTTVEVSDDDGATWNGATLDSRHDSYAWRLWSYSWTPRAKGMSRLLARATDSAGSVQPRESVWNQSGYLYNGWHGVDIEVTT